MGFFEASRNGTSDAAGSASRRDAETNTRDACAPRSSDPRLFRRYVVFCFFDEAAIDAEVFAAADAGEGALFHETQQLRLNGRREVSDLVEEEGAALGAFDVAGFVRGGTGEGTFFVAEKLGFEDLLRQGAATEKIQNAPRMKSVRGWVMKRSAGSTGRTTTRLVSLSIGTAMASQRVPSRVRSHEPLRKKDLHAQDAADRFRDALVLRQSRAADEVGIGLRGLGEDGARFARWNRRRRRGASVRRGATRAVTDAAGASRDKK